MPPVEIRFFGAFDMIVRGKTVGAFRSRRVAVVLLILLKASGAEVSRSYIAGQVWPESTEVQALANLRQSLMDLRKAFGSEAACLVSVDRRSVRLESEGIVCDYSQFQVYEKSHRPERWRDAVDLYRGSLLPGLNEFYVDAEREALERRCLRLLERLLDESTVPEDRANLSLKMLEIDSTHERAACVVIRDRAERGDTAGMIRAYQEVRGALRRLLGLAPSQITTKAYNDALALLARQREKSQPVVIAEQPKELEPDLWNSLDLAEKDFLKRLSIFPGPFSFAEIDSMLVLTTGTPSNWMPILAQLVQVGLVQFSASSLYGPYTLASQLRELPECRADDGGLIAYLECMVTFAEKGYQEFCGPNQRVWLERFECHKENLRRAFKIAVAEEVTPNYAYRFAASISNFFMLSEGSMSLWEELDATSRLTGGDTSLRAKALNAIGFRERTLNLLGPAASHLQEALVLANDDEHLCALIHTNQAMILEEQGNLSESKKLFKQAFKSFQEQGNVYWQAVTEQSLAELESRWGATDGLENTLLKILDVYRQLEDDLQMSGVRMSLSRFYLRRGKNDEARFHQSIAHATIQRLPWPYKQVYSLLQLSEIEFAAQDFVTSEAYASEALRLGGLYGLPPAVVEAEKILAKCAINTRRLAEAEALILASLGRVVETTMAFWVSDFVEILGIIRAKEARFDECLALVALGWSLRKQKEPSLSVYPVSILRVLHELKLAGVNQDFESVEPFDLKSLLAPSV